MAKSCKEGRAERGNPRSSGLTMQGEARRNGFFPDSIGISFSRPLQRRRSLKVSDFLRDDSLQMNETPNRQRGKKIDMGPCNAPPAAIRLLAGFCM